MHQQLPHVPLLQTRHPDPRKPILAQQSQQMLRVPPVRLSACAPPWLGSRPHPPATARTPTPPAAARTTDSARGLHPHPHLLPRQRTVKLLRLLPVLQPFFLNLSRSVVKDRDLLKTRMKITAYNQHDVGSFSRALVCLVATNLLAATGQRRYAIKRSCRSRPQKRVVNAVEGSLPLIGLRS